MESKHPGYYNRGGIEAWDALMAMVEGKPAAEAVLVYNCGKYLWRYDGKNGMEDLLKARNYMDKLIETAQKRYNAAESISGASYVTVEIPRHD